MGRSFPDSSKTEFTESSCISKMETTSSLEELETEIVPLRIDIGRLILRDSDRAYMKEVINNKKTIEDNLCSIEQEINSENGEERSPTPEYSNIMDLIGSDSEDEGAIDKEQDPLTLDDMTTQKMPPPPIMDPELQNL